MRWLIAVAVLLAVVALAITPRREYAPPDNFPAPGPAQDGEPGVATFGSGCFWCTEAVFRRVKGVTNVVSGYSGGSAADANYKAVCTGITGHAEAVQVTFDPAVVSYPELLHVFWRSHDPTTKDQQGWDVGSQYRSVVFYHSDGQRQQAERYKAAIDAAGVYKRPVVTEITRYVDFYPAEAKHQDFYAANPQAPYCAAVIGPKLDKLRAVFGDALKPE